MLRNLITTFGARWRTTLVLLGIFVATLSGTFWIWGVMFIVWAIPGLMSGFTDLAERIDRDDSPYFYWLSIGTPLIIGAYYVIFDLMTYFNLWPRTLDFSSIQQLIFG